MRLYRTIRYIIHMAHHFIATGIVGNKGTGLYILHRYLFNTRMQRQQAVKLFGGHVLVLLYLLLLMLFQVFFHAFHQAVKSNLGSIGNEREYGILKIVINSF